MVRDSSISSWSVCSAAGTATLTVREAPSKQCCRCCNTVFRTKSEEIERLVVRFFSLLGSEYGMCTIINSIDHFFLRSLFNMVKFPMGQTQSDCVVLRKKVKKLHVETTLTVRCVCVERGGGGGGMRNSLYTVV